MKFRKRLAVIVMVIVAIFIFIIGASSGDLSKWFFWVGLILAELVVAAFSRRILFGSEIYECPNCHRQMTRKRFNENGGCPWCGTDLYTKTGKFAK